MKNFIFLLIYALFFSIIINLFVYRKDVKKTFLEFKRRYKALKEEKRKLRKALKSTKRKKIRNISAVKT
jgi:hypothetical protein